MTNIRNSLAGLLLLAFLAVPAFAGTAFQTGHDWTAYLLWASAAGLLVGTVVTTYKFQVPPATALTSGVTAPTAAQAKLINSINVVVRLDDTETTAVLTHNWALAANALALLYPLISWYWTTAGTGQVSFALTDGNTVTITKTTGTGSGGTFNVNLLKPHTIIGPSTP
jgi:hypothetical protein